MNQKSVNWQCARPESLLSMLWFTFCYQFLTYFVHIFSSNKNRNLIDIEEDQIGDPVSSSTRKHLIIDDKLFIQRPSAIEKSNTPVCDFIYRDKSGAKFYTALSQKQRQILWDYLGPAKYHLQGMSYYYIPYITNNMNQNVLSDLINICLVYVW